MTTKKFSNALGNVDESYLDEAISYTPKKKNKVLIKWVSIAACLSLILTGGIIGSLFRSSGGTDDGISSYFVISTLAADGETKELSVTSSCFNSGSAKSNVFGVDMPTFNFDVKPSSLKNNEPIYDRFDISVSYNGITVGMEGKIDEHIMIGYYFSTLDPNERGYSIFGWFAEPTDVCVRILDKESREIVEAYTIHVVYFEDRQEYELTITDLNTKFADQKRAVDANNILMGYLFAKGYVTDYPDWFGGCYIENNKLYVKLTSPSDEELNKIYEILASFKDVVVYKTAEMSMADLQAYADQTANNLILQGYEVTSWYVDSVTGNIVIAVLEKDFEAAKEWIRGASKDSPKIVIEVGEYVELDSIETIEFRAEPFLQSNALSWVYSLDVRIEGEVIYLNDVLYDKIIYVEGFTLDYGPLFPVVYESITAEIDKINSQKGCYILETDGDSKAGKKIAMYIIDDTYYFVRFFDDGSVMRIHSGKAQ
jgi:hypothetical protein